MKIALVYDRVNKWGGAERVLLALNELFPEAPLYTSVCNAKLAPWAKVFPQVIPSFLQRVPFATDRHEHFPYLMPLAFETLNLNGYDLVISVTSEAAKGVITKPPTVHICYCLTPTRYLWSHHETYFKGPTFKAITKPIVLYLRHWDKIAAQRPDLMIAISTAVKKRIKKYYGRNSEVVYPPVDVNRFRNNELGIMAKKDDYYLLVSRLVSYKRVDLAVDTFNEVGSPFVIVGSGSEEKRLRSMAKKNIKFVGELTDKKLASYYQKARALIFPQEEDFGIVAVEAQAAGTPVIAYKAGGALDTVIDPSTGSGQAATGVFFEKQNKESLIDAVNRFNRLKFSKRKLVKNAERFSKEKFKNEFKNVIENVKL